jgi:hypothetical protein
MMKIKVRMKGAEYTMCQPEQQWAGLDSCLFKSCLQNGVYLGLLLLFSLGGFRLPSQS